MADPQIIEQPRTPESLSCARCSMEIGRFVDVDGEDLVQVGSLIVREVSGVCANCGTGFYYSLNARRLEQLIKRASHSV